MRTCLWIMLLGLLGLVGCNDKSGDVSPFTTIVVRSEAAEMSRMIIEGDKTTGYVASWERGDKVGGLLVGSAGNLSAPFVLQAVDVTESGVASFSGVTKAVVAQSTLYTYYPYKGAAPQSLVVEAEVPAVQTMTDAGSYDAAAAYMVGKPVTLESASDGAVEVTTKFRQLNCFVNLSCRLVALEGVLASDVVRSVRLSAEGKVLSGEFLLDVSNGECSFTAAKSEVSVNVPQGMTLGELSAWIVVNPFELTTADEMIVEIVTDRYVISKRIAGRIMEFPQRRVITLNLAVDESCTLTSSVASAQSVTYTITGKTSVEASGSLLECVTAAYTQKNATVGRVGRNQTAQLTLTGLGDRRISEVSMSLQAGKVGAMAQYEVLVGSKVFSGYLNSSSWSDFSVDTHSKATLFASAEPLVADNGNLTMTLLGLTSDWFHIESITIICE